jgi:hypothetical protein
MATVSSRELARRRRRRFKYARARGPVAMLRYTKTADGYRRPAGRAPEYGATCPDCGGTKSRQALRCSPCYFARRSVGNL